MKLFRRMNNNNNNITLGTRSGANYCPYLYPCILVYAHINRVFIFLFLIIIILLIARRDSFEQTCGLVLYKKKKKTDCIGLYDRIVREREVVHGGRRYGVKTKTERNFWRFFDASRVKRFWLLKSFAATPCRSRKTILSPFRDWRHLYLHIGVLHDASVLSFIFYNFWQMDTLP